MSKTAYNDTMRGNFTAAFARRADAPVAVTTTTTAKPHEGRKQLPGACLIEIGRVEGDPHQPRTDWTSDEAIRDLQDLADSIKARGQLQPIRVRWDADASLFRVVVGERRLRAAKMAGLATIACVVVEDNRDESDRTEDMLVENALRAGLTPIDSAKAYQQLIDAKGYTHRQLAERLNIPHPAVTQAMQLLTLPETIQEAVDAGEIKPSVAYEIAKIEDPAEQVAMASEAAAGRLSRTEARERVAQSAGRGWGAGSARPSAGRSKVKARPLPTEVKHKAANGIKLTGERRKGFTQDEWIAALIEALTAARDNLGSSEARATLAGIKSDEAPPIGDEAAA